MDVVNGKIVSARTERTSLAEVGSALRPSRGLTVESMQGNPDHLRGNGLEWAPSWAAPSSFSNESQRNAWGGPGAAPCHDPPNSLALEAGLARWNQLPSSEKHHSGALHEYTGLQPLPVTEHRQGWGGDQQRQYHSGAHPWTETKLDQTVMAMYESRAVPDYFTATSSLGQESPTLYLPSENSECSMQRSWSDCRSRPQECEAQSIPNLSSLVGTSSDLKRKRLDTIICSEEADQVDCGWSHPLKLLIRKGLSLSDVGELGRIVIPKILSCSLSEMTSFQSSTRKVQTIKKYAESTTFQQIDTKEGALLEMEDYTSSKRWFFRFKWWINNRSRMYVLENTGEFIKYHNLKEHDIFVVYEDSFKKLVVRGHKGTDLDSMLDILQGTSAGSSSEKSSSTKGEGPASTTLLS